MVCLLLFCSCRYVYLYNVGLKTLAKHSFNDFRSLLLDLSGNDLETLGLEIFNDITVDDL